MDRIEKISNSALDRFVSCPLSYYNAYILKEKQLDVVSFYSDYGILIHFLAEMYPRINYYKDLPFEDMEKEETDSLDSYINSFGKIMVKETKELNYNNLIAIYNKLFPMIVFPNETTKIEYYEQGIKFIENIPTIDWSKVIGLEQKFDYMLDDLKITGVIDKIERDDKGLIVTDYKTSKPYGEIEMKKKNQLPIYGMACYFLYGEVPYKYRYHFTRFNKVVEVEIPIERLTQAKNFIKFKQGTINTHINEGVFPARYNKFYCNNFCGYKHKCPTYQQYEGE
jgi:hypothetical protein